VNEDHIFRQAHLPHLMDSRSCVKRYLRASVVLQ
jgi:hypothetical protein